MRFDVLRHYWWKSGAVAGRVGHLLAVATALTVVAVDCPPRVVPIAESLTLRLSERSERNKWTRRDRANTERSRGSASQRLILPAVILSRFLSDIRLDTVQNPVSRTGPFHVVTAGSMSERGERNKWTRRD